MGEPLIQEIAPRKLLRSKDKREELIGEKK